MGKKGSKPRHPTGLKASSKPAMAQKISGKSRAASTARKGKQYATGGNVRTPRQMRSMNVEVEVPSTSSSRLVNLLNKLTRNRKADVPARDDVEAMVYLDTDDAVVALNVAKAVQDMLDEMGYSKSKIDSVERSSIILNIRAWWNGEDVKLFAKNKGKKLAVDLEHYAELATVEKKQAEVDDLRSQAAARLIDSLANTPQACVLVGAILILKYPGSNGGEPTLTASTLTTMEVAAYKQHRGLQKDPATVIENLAAIVAEHNLDQSQAITP